MNLQSPDSLSSGEVPKRWDKRMVWLLILSGVLVIGLSGIFGYVLGVQYQQSLEQKNASTVRVAASEPRNEKNQNNTKTETLTETDSVSNEKNLSFVGVRWQTPQKIAGLNLVVNGGALQNAVYYKIGEVIITQGDKKTDVVLLIAEDSTLPFGGSSHYVFFQDDSSLTLLEKYSSYIPKKGDYEGGLAAEQFKVDSLYMNKFVIDRETAVADLEFPAKIVAANPRQTAKQEVKLIPVSELPETYAVNISVGDRKVYASAANGALYVVDAKASFASMYIYEPDIYDKDNMTPEITWNDGTKNTSEYSYATFGGCGRTNYADVVVPGDLSIEKDMIQIGKTVKGDAVYALKNNQSEILQTMYKDFPTDPEQTYNEFLASEPLFYWADPFGRLIKFKNKKYQSMAECGKPVIYLYPKEKTEVFVKVEPQGGMTYSDPAHNDGWTVTAEPNGQLVEVSTARNYPYLFWEGQGSYYEQPKKGWVVKQTNLESFLRLKLKQLGMNKIETRDFLDFWLPRMNEKPYYFVTFLGNKAMDELAPLTVEPKPDTTIRILMDFAPLDKPIKVEPLKIKTPVRKGFTLVEWGGVLR